MLFTVRSASLEYLSHVPAFNESLCYLLSIQRWEGSREGQPWGLHRGSPCLPREDSEILSADCWLVLTATQVHPPAAIPWKQPPHVSWCALVLEGSLWCSRATRALWLIGTKLARPEIWKRGLIRRPECPSHVPCPWFWKVSQPQSFCLLG